MIKISVQIVVAKTISPPPEDYCKRGYPLGVAFTIRRTEE